MKKQYRESIKFLLTKISPKLETTINYKYVTGEWLDWKNPQDINAKINWLKVKTYYNNPLITMCIDKYRIREYLHSKDMDFLCPNLYGVYDDSDEINWGGLPNQYVLKCNHSCGANLIVKDSRQLNIEEACKKLKKWLKEDYWASGEVQYKYIKKKIIAEEYLGDGDNLKTYKFFCFNGEPRILYVSLEEDKYINYYDIDFNLLNMKLEGHENYQKQIKRSDNFEEMIKIAKKLSADFPFVRVDLYDSFGKIYISELTFIPTGGYMKITPRTVLKEWGEWLKLP